MVKRKLLILGAKGMLGQELEKVFKRDETYAVTSWDREEIDVTNQKELNEKISRLKPKVIINATGYNAVDKCENDQKEKKLARKLNGTAVRYLAEIAQNSGATLVHYSSDYVFNGQPAIPEPKGCAHHCAGCALHQGFAPIIGFDELAKPQPISEYGKSKLMGEKMIQKYAKKYYLIRTSKIFGLPANNAYGKKSFFAIMLEAGRKAKKEKTIIKAIDEETSCFTYAPDLAKKTKEIIESKKPWGIYHITNSDPVTWYEGVLELYKQASLRVKVEAVTGEAFPRPAKRPYYSALLNTKLNPLRSYKLALKDFIKTLKSLPDFPKNAK